MNSFKDYEEMAGVFALYPDAGKGYASSLAYTALGLCGESGEYSEKIKKYIRDGSLDKSLAVKELGDVLWYLTAAARELGYSLQDVAEINIVKLNDRAQRGVLKGSGDSR
jgi:NTP pyrophosphatase (non-canonical NTP hydrolase)